MSSEALFLVVNLGVLPFWALMVFAPGWVVTRRVMGSPLAPAALAVLYTALVAPLLPAMLPGLVQLPDLSVIAPFLGTPQGALLVWVHAVAFDLFVGRWEYLDARERGVPHWALAPSLLLTLYFGPMGLLLYLGLKRLTAPSGGPPAPAP